MSQLVCSECGEKLPPTAAPTRKTCSDEECKAAGRPACRERRKTRLKRARDSARRIKSANGGPEHDYRDTPMQKAVTHQLQGEIGKKILADELRPLVRDALTDNVLQSLLELVAVTPDVVARISEDVNSKDPVVRQKAYTLFMRYVLGHGAVQPKDEAAQGAFHIHFDSMPRPDGFGGGTDDDPETQQLIDAIEVPDGHRVCEDCQVPKPLDCFDEEAPRCDDCLGEYKRKVLAEYGRTADA